MPGQLGWGWRGRRSRRGRRRRGCRTCRRTTCRAGWRRTRRRPRRGRSGTSSAPCRQAAIRPASRRARDLERGGVGRAARASSSIARSRRGSAPRASPTSVIQAFERLGLAGQRAQHVEGVDVAGALPDRVQRRLAEEQRHPGLLDVAVAAQALQRLGDHHRRALADPELRQRQRDPAQRRLVRVVRGGRRPRPAAWPSAVAASDSTARSATTFCISGLSASSAAERRAVRDVPRRLGERAAHQRRRAEHAVEPGGGDHLDDRAHAAALVAEPLRPGAVELQLARTRWSGCPACP